MILPPPDAPPAVFKSYVLEYCVPISREANWSQWRNIEYYEKVYGVFQSRRVFNEVIVTDWVDLYELGDAANVGDLVSYLAALYRQDPDIYEVSSSWHDSSMLMWQDCRCMQYRIKSVA